MPLRLCDNSSGFMTMLPACHPEIMNPNKAQSARQVGLSKTMVKLEELVADVKNSESYHS